MPPSAEDSYPSSLSPSQQAYPQGSSTPSVSHFPASSEGPNPPWMEAFNSPHWKEFSERWESGVNTHVRELKRRLVWVGGLFGFNIVLGFFLASPLLKLIQQLAPESTTFVQLAPSEVLVTLFQTTIIIALALTSPFAVFHSLRFLFPGLKAKEQQACLLLCLFGALFFMAGLAFSWWFVLPTALAFLLNVGDDLAVNQISLARHTQFCLFFLGMAGLMFEGPLLLVGLAKLGWVKAKQLRSKWREAVVGICLLTAVITPTQDPITMLIMAAALVGLYGLSILMVGILEKK